MQTGFAKTFSRDLTSGLVVFLVALPLCLGVALASNAPLFSGIIAGIVGGLIVGVLSGSQTSVAGPAAGLTAVVAAQILKLGSFETFLMAVVFAGVIQLILGISRAGFIAEFFPTSVIKGLLAAIGLILILKQIPHLLGHDTDPEGDMAFEQPDHENTISEIYHMIGDLNMGAAIVGITSLLFLVGWDRIKRLKHSPVPAPLIVVLIGVGLSWLLGWYDEELTIGASHLVQVPVADQWSDLKGFITMPDWSKWREPDVYVAAFTVAIIASLETLLNLEAVDRLDPAKRVSPPNRELMAQGVGNICAGLMGGIPVTSVIIRSSVNINAGSKTKISTIVHGALLALCVVFVPVWINQIPLACLAAILLHTGFKLASYKLFRQMWKTGLNQFLPFVITVVAIVLTDLLIGILIGLAVSIAFILYSNYRSPIRQVHEKHLTGDLVRVELASQVSFLNRAALTQALDNIPRGGNVLIDATSTDYIDPDVLDLIHDYQSSSAPARNVKVSLVGFKERYKIPDRIEYVDYSNRETQRNMAPAKVLELLRVGNERFLAGKQLKRDLSRAIGGTADGQFPLAAVLTCIDSRTPTELIFDLGLGDAFTVRIAGNVAREKVLGSLEYACAVAGAKLLLVMGHTRCGAVTAAVDLKHACKTAAEATQCQHIDALLDEIQQAIEPKQLNRLDEKPKQEREALVDLVARQNVLRTKRLLLDRSDALRRLVEEQRIMMVGAMYDVRTGRVDFIVDE